MALGGLTGLCLAAWYPELVRRLVMVDVAGPARRHERHPDRLTRLYAELPGYAELARGVRCPTTLVLDGRSRVLAAAGVDRLRAAIPQLEVVTVDTGGPAADGRAPDLLGAVERTGTPAGGTR
jgi:pimeloyl-ACP methyl ester carboxylesterase